MNTGKSYIALSVLGALAALGVACGPESDLQGEEGDWESDPGIESTASIGQKDTCIDMYRYATAFRGENGHLWVDTNALWKGDTGGAIAGYTSPSIAQLQNSKYVVAFRGTNGRLWVTIGTASSQSGSDVGRTIAANTSPSVTRLSDDKSYAVAYQGGTNELWIYIRYSNGSTSYVRAMCSGTPCKMNPGTSPSIAALPNNDYEVVFQAPVDGNGDTRLSYYGGWWTAQSAYGMLAGTSPSIAWVSGRSDFAAAFNANTQKLWIVDGWGGFEDQTNQPIASNPSIASNGTSSYTVAYRKSTDSKLCKWVAGAGPGTGCTSITMKASTSPSIAAWGSDYEIAAQGSDGYLYYSGPMCKTGKQTAKLNNTSSPSIAVASTIF